MSQLMQRLLYPYMAPKGDGDDGDGPSEAELAKERGDDLDLDEDEEDKGKKKDDDEEDEEDKGKKKDDEGEEDEEGKDKKKDDEDEEVEDDAGKKKPPPATIPKARFDELRTKSQEKIRGLEKQLEDTLKGVQKDTEVKQAKDVETAIEKLDVEAAALLQDGKNAEAMAKMREIRTLERDLATMRAQDLSRASRDQAVEQARVDLLLDRLEDQYPQIDPDNEAYDEEVVAEVLFLRASFEKNGMSSSQAITKAVQYVFVHRVADEDEKARKDEKGDKDEGKKGLRGDAKDGDRKKAAIDRNAKDAKKLPSRQDSGVDSDKKGGGDRDVKEMTEEEFAALPESTKARARGDYV